MRKSLLAALMAATVLVPTTAWAQDDQEHRGGRDRGNQGAPRSAAPRNGGGEQRGYQRPQQQVQVQPQVQVQAQAPVQVQPQAQVLARPQGERGGRGYRPEGGRPDFQGGRGGFGNGQAQQQWQQQQQLRQQQQQARPTFQGQQGYRGNDPRGGNPQAFQRDGRNDIPGDGRRDDRGGGFNPNRGNDQRGNGSYNNRGGYNNGAWNREWRRDNRYNYSAYRNQNRNAFRLPRYYAPYGWDYGYRRFSIGFTLSSVLFNQDYWIEDADYYRLPPAYGPYRWVRYCNDALLVDLRSGYVVDTVYDIFW